MVFVEQFRVKLHAVNATASLLHRLDRAGFVRRTRNRVAGSRDGGHLHRLWTSGYRPAFGWIELPVLDELGLPITEGGARRSRGLSFIGTPWMVDMGSANLVGLVRDAEALAVAAWVGSG